MKTEELLDSGQQTEGQEAFQRDGGDWGGDDLRITIAGLNPKESDNLEKTISKEDDDNKFEAFKDSTF